MRSLWKGKFFNFTIFRSKNQISEKLVDEKYLNKKLFSYYIWNRNSFIPMFFNKKRIGVHNGKIFKSFIVKNRMVTNFKFGEFSLTKSLGKRIHIYKKKIKKKKKEKTKEEIMVEKYKDILDEKQMNTLRILIREKEEDDREKAEKKRQEEEFLLKLKKRAERMEKTRQNKILKQERNLAKIARHQRK